jgi:hypothetical protein
MRHRIARRSSLLLRLLETDAARTAGALVEVKSAAPRRLGIK